MDMKNILIFALIGAVCFMVVAGGIVSMYGEGEPSTGHLAAGAVAGGVLGSALSFVSGAEVPGAAAVLSAVTGSSSSVDMKVGLPSF